MRVQVWEPLRVEMQVRVQSAVFTFQYAALKNPQKTPLNPAGAELACASVRGRTSMPLRNGSSASFT